MKISKKFLLLCALLAVFVSGCFDVTSENVNESISVSSEVSVEMASDFVKATVTEVVDGDTVWVDIDGGRYKIRLIGLNSPEIAHDDIPAQPLGDEAKNFTTEKLSGQVVYLESDVNDTDKYGRLLRYVWLEIPTEDTLKQASDKLFNYLLIREGYARQKTYGEDSKYEQYLKDAAKNAEKR